MTYRIYYSKVVSGIPVSYDYIDAFSFYERAQIINWIASEPNYTYLREEII